MLLLVQYDSFHAQATHHEKDSERILVITAYDQSGNRSKNYLKTQVLLYPPKKPRLYQLLEEFLVKARRFRQNEQSIDDMAEPWMGNPEAALSESRHLAKIQTDFIKRPADVTLNWNLKTRRLWISFNDFVNIDSRVADPLLQLIRNIPTYSNQRKSYEEQIESRNEKIDESLEITEG